MTALVYIFRYGQFTEAIPYKFEYNKYEELQDHCFDRLLNMEDTVNEVTAYDTGMNKILFNGYKSEK